MPAAVALGEAHGALVGLGAGVAEEALLQVAGRDLGETLRELGRRRHVVGVGAGVHQLVGLRLGGLDDLAVAVAGVGHGDAGEAVDVLGAVLVPEDGALPVIHDDRLDALHEPGHDVVAVLLLHTHAIDHPSAHADNEERGAAQRLPDELGRDGRPGGAKAERAISAWTGRSASASRRQLSPALRGGASRQDLAAGGRRPRWTPPSASRYTWSRTQVGR